MLKKSLASVAVPVLLFALSCQSRTEPTATDTAATDTSTGVTASAPPAVQAPNPPEVVHEIDHYRFWTVDPTPFVKSVSLKGQFDQAPWNASVTSIEFLGNPVEKNGGPILKPEWHLVAYSLQAPPQPVRTITIENQFVKGLTLKITHARWLLLPASKSLEGKPAEPPKDADHYVCYTVHEPVHEVTNPVTLVDQFERRRGVRAEEIKQLTASFFCVPVSKNGAHIFKPKEHLTLYRIDPPAPYAITVETRDQFGQRKLSVFNGAILAVPTFKEWQPPQ